MSEVLQTQILVQGMCCSKEGALIHTILEDVPGIASVKVNVVSRKAIVRHDPSRISVEAVVEKLNEAKLGATVQESGVAAEKVRFSLSPWAIALFAAECVAFLVAVAGFAKGWAPAKWVALGTAIVASYSLVRGAAIALVRRCTIDMNVLMLISVGGAAGYGFYVPRDAAKSWIDAALVVVLFNASEHIAAYASVAVSNALSDALSTAPSTAMVAATSKAIAVEDITVGMVLAVRTGDRVPVDGVVVKGRALVDESAVTGESLPVAKAARAKFGASGVIGGTVVANGYLEVRSTAVARESAAARIADAVAEAQASSSPTAQLVDTFAKYYTPAVVLGAIALFCALRFVAKAPLRSSLTRALTLVVAACPCALVMAAPIAVACTVASTARDLGVLIKSGASVEALAGMRALCMDKTGTLTLGKFTVVATRGFGEFGGGRGAEGIDAALRLAAAVEAKSRHPLASAIVEASIGCVALGIEDAGGDLNAGLPLLTERMITTAGVGVSSTVEGRAVAVGSHRLLATEEAAAVDDRALAAPVLAAWDKEALTPVLVTIDGRLALMLALADAPRGTAFDAVAELQGRVTGVDVVMLTGDRAAPAEATARALGLRGGCFAELLPAEKLARLEALKLSAGGGVGMVGDGINDAPALAASDVGIAMGSGLALAADSADVVLLSDNLRAIPAAIAAARACRTVVRTNIAIAAAVKLTMVALVLGWRGTQLWMGVVSDVGALLLVTLNGTRLLGAKVVISPNVNVSADVEAGGEVAAAREKSPLLSSATVTPDFNTF